MYGQTEAGPRITTLQSDEFPENSASVGRALSGGLLSIIDDDGKAKPPGIEGNVVYQGPNVMMGYATSREDLALPDVLGGRLETGDRGILSNDGILTLTGRMQRFAKIAGLRIALNEIESFSARPVQPRRSPLTKRSSSILSNRLARVSRSGLRGSPTACTYLAQFSSRGWSRTSPSRRTARSTTRHWSGWNEV